MEKIYLDYNATSPIDKRVVNEMKPYIENRFYNPSSFYKDANINYKAIKNARNNIADLLNAEVKEIIFTSGGTEADNHAIKSTMLKYDNNKHIITSKIEHHAVLHTCKYLEELGYDVTYLNVDNYGLVDPDDFKKAIKENTVMASIMMANNEIGTIEPVKKLAKIAHENDILFHTDAVQAVGKIPIDVKDLNIDMLSLSGHKFNGPKGIGALYKKNTVNLAPLLHGGSQENGKRAGTENIPAIIGLWKAAEIAKKEQKDEKQKIKPLRDKLEKKLFEKIPELLLNGHPEKRLYNTLNICIKGIEGEGVLALLDRNGILASSGSACTSGSLDPSHVLLSIGRSHGVAHGSLRLSLGKYTKEEDIDKVINVLPDVVKKLRAMSPLWNN